MCLLSCPNCSWIIVSVVRPHLCVISYSKFSTFPQNHPWYKIRACKWSQECKEQICSEIRRGEESLLFNLYKPIKFYWVNGKCPYIRMQWNIKAIAEIRCKGISSECREDFFHCWLICSQYFDTQRGFPILISHFPCHSRFC